MEILAKSEEELIEAGVNFAKNLDKPKIIILQGDLGAGKTYFTKGIAKGLGIDEEIISPTFVLSRFIENKPGLNLLHIDIYRILEYTHDLKELENQIDELGVFEREIDSVIVIEWGEVLKELFERRIDVVIKVNSDSSRTIKATFN